MNVRNFYLKAKIDGRKTELKGGPARKDGGFYQTLYIRNAGEIEDIIHTEGYVTEEGKLKIIVAIKEDNGNIVRHEIIRER